MEFLNIDEEPQDFLKIREYSANIVLDIQCEASSNILDMTSNKRLFNATRSFIIFGTLNETLEVLQWQDINVNSKILVVDSDGLIFNIKSAERRRGTPLHATMIGNYSNDGLLSMNAMKINNSLDGNPVFVAINVGLIQFCIFGLTLLYFLDSSNTIK